MEIRARLYPYPVLSSETDDYTGSTFSFDVTAKQQVREISFNISISLDNEELQRRIDMNEAEFLIHIECSRTSYREAIVTSDTNIIKLVADKKLYGNVSVCVFIVASKDIHGYTNANFNEDYEGMAFDVEKGGILAVGGQWSVQVKKETEDLTKVPSIFMICRGPDAVEDCMDINIDNDKIRITLSESSFKNYKLLCSSQAKLSIFHSMVIVPALIYAFENIRKDDVSVYEGRRWFKALKRTLAKYDIVLNKETIENKHSYYLAQKLMESPINKAFAAALLDPVVDDEE